MLIWGTLGRADVISAATAAGSISFICHAVTDHRTKPSQLSVSCEYICELLAVGKSLQWKTWIKRDCGRNGANIVEMTTQEAHFLF